MSNVLEENYYSFFKKKKKRMKKISLAMCPLKKKTMVRKQIWRSWS